MIATAIVAIAALMVAVIASVVVQPEPPAWSRLSANERDVPERMGF